MMLAITFSAVSWISYFSHPVTIAIAVAALAAVATFAATVVVWPTSSVMQTPVAPRPAITDSTLGSSIAPVILPFQASREQPVQSGSGRVTTVAPPRSEKRRTLRRKGVPVPVLVNHATKPGDTELAWVMDRSTGGLRLIFNRALPKGDEFSIRAENAPDDLPWVGLRVSHSRQSGKRWILGCQFIDPLPWSVLLLFG
jgi:hypothetical protein